MISIRNRLSVLFISSTLGLAACTKVAPPITTNQPTNDIFSNRPITEVPDLYMVTLSEPPILEFSTKHKNGWYVPASAKARLLAEQTRFEESLKKLSPTAQVVYRYRMTLNAISFYAPSNVTAQVMNLPGVKSVAAALEMARPQALDIKPGSKISGVNSVNFIGAEEVHKKGITGKGMRIGVLDSGVDYTHAMLGGSGKPDEFESIDPAQPSSLFPNAKVVGGIDVVGSDFNAASKDSVFHLPKPDANPIDESGHGTHVAGTVAGLGDGVNTYSGVAPDASIYAIKVFGKDGSTADAAVIAGFEFAADPNGDLNPDDQLDVINMSLGGGFGQPRILYNRAVRALARAGTVVVASAGNSGPVDYIVGAPSTADEAISIAASIDGAPINWQFASVKINLAQPLYVKVVEGPISKPVAEAGAVSGELVDIGDASVDLSAETKAALNGKVALIVRGKVSFAVKLQRAVDAGAIGAIVYTNDGNEPIAMGGDGKVEIPAIMVSQAIGLQILAQMKTAPVTVEFKTDKLIEEPGNIDTITSFSSKGPRSEDNLFKPEIAAPGQAVTSAAMGKGVEGVHMNGTSMAAPHMAGVMALVKQAHPDLTSKQLKSLVMGTSKVLATKGEDIPMTLQGAGRVQLLEAVEAPVISETPAFSLGRVQVAAVKELHRTIVLRNLTGSDLSLTTQTKSTPGMQIDVASSVTVPAHGKAKVKVKYTLTIQNADQLAFELDGRVFFLDGAKTVLQVPAMAIRTQTSTVSADKSGDLISLKNSSPVAGLAMPFNLIGDSPRKPLAPSGESWKARNCDLQSVGYRVLQKTSRTGTVESVIQFAIKVFDPVTTWITCSNSVLIDVDGDGIADQEIAGITGSGLEGLERSAFSTVVLDAAKARAIRLNFEQALSNKVKDATADYTPAVMAKGMMAPFQHSTVMVIEAPLKVLKPAADGKLHVKIATQSESDGTFQPDDYLGAGESGDWFKLSTVIEDQAYYGMEELTVVTAAGATETLKKGNGQERLVLYYPLNTFRAGSQDGQQQIF